MFALGTIRLPMGTSFFVKNVFENFYREDCVYYALHSKFAHFPTFFCYFLKYSNVVYHSYTFLVNDKVYLSFKQKSGFTKGIKQKISVKVSLPPLNGHGDCATDHCVTHAYLSNNIVGFTCVLKSNSLTEV